MGRVRKFPLILQVGVNVVIRISDVGKGETDLLNRIGVVLEKREHDLKMEEFRTDFIAVVTEYISMSDHEQ